MSVIDRRIAAASRDAASARARFTNTVDELRTRLSPHNLARETVDQASSNVAHLLGEAATVVRARPWMIALGSTVAGLAVAAYRRGPAGTNDAVDEATNTTSES